MGTFQYYVIALKIDRNCITLNNILRDKGYEVRIVSTPCSLSLGCSKSIRIRTDDIEEVKEEIVKNNIAIRGIYLMNFKERGWNYIRLEDSIIKDSKG